MSHEITLEQAAERAHQIEIIARMIEQHPHRMDWSEVEAVAALIGELSGSVVIWLGGEMAQRAAK
ncbi:hypothetical protein [Pantoea sp. 1.19]|uniref:hypothetical protein n=1 Tax=Pantoea sp. 1.19 TaxID=1925589 RepID=UPI000948EF88|nr:hypothetical protein [Pantoea sp. 1.19]